MSVSCRNPAAGRSFITFPTSSCCSSSANPPLSGRTLGSYFLPELRRKARHGCWGAGTQGDGTPCHHRWWQRRMAVHPPARTFGQCGLQERTLGTSHAIRQSAPVRDSGVDHTHYSTGMLGNMHRNLGQTAQGPGDMRQRYMRTRGKGTWDPRQRYMSTCHKGSWGHTAQIHEDTRHRYMGHMTRVRRDIPHRYVGTRGIDPREHATQVRGDMQHRDTEIYHTGAQGHAAQVHGGKLTHCT